MKIKPIRVLHVVGSMDFGGIETWLMHVLRRMDRSRVQFDFCCTMPAPGAFAPEIESLGGKIPVCPLDRFRLGDFARRFRSILREGRYDVVHSHVHHFSGHVLRVANQEGAPMRIAHCHNTSDGKGSGALRMIYHAWMRNWIRRHATHGLAASRDAAAALFGGDWQSDARFRVLHCGIDLEPFREQVSRDAIRQELGIPLDSPVVGHVGRFVPQKNHAFLLEIAVETVHRRPEARFLLVGDGPLRPEMENKARGLGIGTHVIFAGIRSDVARLMMGAMDTFVMPSVWEGLGLVIVEAQASGLRSVISDCVPQEVAAIPDLVKSVRLDARPRVWAEAILEAEKRGRMGRDFALQAIEASDFSLEHSMLELVHLYGGTETPPAGRAKLA